MEPRGCNRWQPLASHVAAKPAQQAKTVGTACDQLPESFHGKEGVDGSSPSEGSVKPPQTGVFALGSYADLAA
jgi:hypothetical protein